ncbi:MAG: L-aspartate oxidase [Chthonomonadetes bacterium]|nr:L-aspartate oxidase [Chthonomonadetes bacterium]
MSVHRTDFVVIGSGIAGLTFALRVAEQAEVVVITKKERSESNTNYAQGGIAGVMSPEDTFELHMQDTLNAGAGLCHEDAVRVLVQEGPRQIRRLIELGARFDMERDAQGNPVLALGREGGHSRNRIVHYADQTGWEIERTLLEATRYHPRVTIYEHFFALDLIIQNGECVGVWVLNTHSDKAEAFLARAVLLATGGCGQVYPHTTNPPIATGDGIGMAWRAGACIANMEFMQFHPTTLYHPGARSFLISEAVRGEGAILRLPDGTPFMEKYHPMKDLAPRDVVARAIDAETKRLGIPCVYLDITHRPEEFLRQRFPVIYSRLESVGIDMAREWIPVVPAAHYMCGGVQTDLHGRTSIPRLYAAGEVACTGVHGANRLASNSLLEALVFADRAGIHALEASWSEPAMESVPSPDRIVDQQVEPSEETDVRRRLHSVMHRKVGIVRRLASLEEAARELEQIERMAQAVVCREPHRVEAWEDWNLSITGNLIVQCALRRRESRGLHTLVDHPNRDDEHFRRDTVLCRREIG